MYVLFSHSVACDVAVGPSHQLQQLKAQAAEPIGAAVGTAGVPQRHAVVKRGKRTPAGRVRAPQGEDAVLDVPHVAALYDMGKQSRQASRAPATPRSPGPNHTQGRKLDSKCDCLFTIPKDNLNKLQSTRIVFVPGVGGEVPQPQQGRRGAVRQPADQVRDTKRVRAALERARQRFAA
jgi:hypothetical protein